MRVHVIRYSILTGRQCWRYAAAGAAEPAEMLARAAPRRCYATDGRMTLWKLGTRSMHSMVLCDWPQPMNLRKELLVRTVLANGSGDGVHTVIASDCTLSTCSCRLALAQSRCMFHARAQDTFGRRNRRIAQDFELAITLVMYSLPPP